jgi:hypothetical protein
MDWDETLARVIKQSTRQRGKGRTKREDPSQSQKCKNSMQITQKGKETKLCSGALIGCKKHIKKEKGNLKIRVEQNKIKNDDARY